MTTMILQIAGGIVLSIIALCIGWLAIQITVYLVAIICRKCEKLVMKQMTPEERASYMCHKVVEALKKENK